MTAPGGDLLAWLGNAISVREAAATAAVDEYGADWYYDDGFVLARREDDMVATGSQDFLEPSQGRHIAANDPASVLRRCAGDRKLLKLHNTPGVVFPDGAYLDDNRWCVGCGYGNDGEPLTSDVNECPTLRAIAEGYGWTEGER
ncbi:DUF6221 family protein [Streptomyces sp. NPDC101117]|uniref:DUF6221 family protein n=1 Tax=Streptomyces sp. NPDC101117 TaxID=3366108 RepID=UPI00380EE330